MSKYSGAFPVRLRSNDSAIPWTQLNRQRKTRGISLDEAVLQPHSSFPVKGFFSAPAAPGPDLSRYFWMFEELDYHKTGKLGKAEAQVIFERTARLSPAEVAQIWQLSDLDKDGMLTFTEFGCAMQFVEKLKQGVALPQQSSVEPRRDVGKAQSARVPPGHAQSARAPATRVGKPQSAQVPASAPIHLTGKAHSVQAPPGKARSARAPAGSAQAVEYVLPYASPAASNPSVQVGSRGSSLSLPMPSSADNGSVVLPVLRLKSPLTSSLVAPAKTSPRGANRTPSYQPGLATQVKRETSAQVTDIHYRSPSLGSKPAATPNPAYRVVQQAQLTKTTINAANRQASWAIKGEDQSPGSAATTTDTIAKDPTPTSPATPLETPPAMPQPRPKIFRDVPSTALLTKVLAEQEAQAQAQEASVVLEGTPTSLEEMPAGQEALAAEEQALAAQEEAPATQRETPEVSDEQVATVQRTLRNIKAILPGVIPVSQAEGQLTSRELELEVPLSAAPQPQQLEGEQPETQSLPLQLQGLEGALEVPQEASSTPAISCLEKLEQLTEVTVPVLEKPEGSKDSKDPLHIRARRLSVSLVKHQGFRDSFGDDAGVPTRRRSSTAPETKMRKLSLPEITVMVWQCKERLDEYMQADKDVARETCWVPTPSPWSRIWHKSLVIMQSDAWKEVVRLHLFGPGNVVCSRTDLTKLVLEDKSFTSAASFRRGNSPESTALACSRIVRTMTHILDVVDWEDLERP